MCGSGLVWVYGLTLSWGMFLVCVWGPGSAFLEKSSSYDPSVELCVCMHAPVFLAGGPGLYRVCHWHVSVGLFQECLHLWDVWVFIVVLEGS